MRLACDTGGTFTDLIVEDNNNLKMFKSSTTPDDPVNGVLNSINLAAKDYNLSTYDFLNKAETFTHATTRSINAVLTGNIAKTAFFTTSGHKDILLLREGGRVDPFNFEDEYPEPFIPRSRTFEIKERIGFDGKIIKKLEIESVMNAIEQCKILDIEAIGICFLWSISNSKHEKKVAEIIKKNLPNVKFTLSHDLNPTLREYRRAISTCLDASLKPLMFNYLSSLENRLRKSGFNGKVFMVTSQGGINNASNIAKTPIHSLGSGPAMAPVAGKHFANSENTDKNVIVADTGGTSYDVSLVRGNIIPWTRETWLGSKFKGHMTGFPSVDVKSIGAGGGSIAWVDKGGLLHVGPKSAGSSPGPVCYDKGGKEPTVTDCALILGILDPKYFLGGSMILNKETAISSVKEKLAKKLNISVEDCATAVMSLATEKMVAAIEELTINQGIDPKSSILIGGGGAAGLNAVSVARRLGCEKAIIPSVGAALSASGALLSDMSSEYAKIYFTNGKNFDFDEINKILLNLRKKCDEFIKLTGSVGKTKIEFFVEARYPQQIWEIDIPLKLEKFDKNSLGNTLKTFHTVHKQIFEICDLTSDVEFVNWRAKVSCKLSNKVIDKLEVSKFKNDKRDDKRNVYFSGTGWKNVNVFNFETLDSNEKIYGPAIIDSSFTTIVIDPDTNAVKDGKGSLVININ